ncbi:hypothetical protein NBRC13296_12230 [Paenibacillus chitinolyticus]|uniref:hypothetical protein n=1 Tax=Paenibacillus chitinolyticus TaxID=79263 RepID=UPI003558B185
MSIKRRDFVYIHNEIFDDLKTFERINTGNIATVYCYYCLLCYLYRYCKYPMSAEKIKQMLGYSSSYTNINKIIKRNGLTDQIGLTHSTRDFPLQYKYDNGELSFTTYLSLDTETRRLVYSSNNYFIKQPLKALYRSEESKHAGIKDGTFFTIESTHLFDFSFFRLIRDEIGLNGFYIYQYLSHKCDLFLNGYDIGIAQLSQSIGISKRTISRCLDLLLNKGYINITQSYIRREETKANVYSISGRKS